MRLFRSSWAYLFWLALCLDEIRHELHPHRRPAMPPWHPAFNGILFTFADIFCIALAFQFAKLTSNALERAALALFAITFALSAMVDLHKLDYFHTPLPSFRLIFLTINTVLAILAVIRFLQALREPPTPGVLTRSTE